MNKKMILWGLVFVIVIVSSVLLKNLLFPSSSETLYGNRLKGIEDIQITTDKKEDIKSSLLEEDLVTEASVRLQGKIINIMIDVKADTDLVEAKSVMDKMLNLFSSEEKDYYDMQFFITKSTDDENISFPMIGYKNKNSTIIVWTK